MQLVSKRAVSHIQLPASEHAAVGKRGASSGSCDVANSASNVVASKKIKKEAAGAENRVASVFT
eukprot:10663849-Lingulodinium_polyedra.AAC.1